MPQPVDRHLAHDGDRRGVEQLGDVLAHERRADDDLPLLVDDEGKKAPHWDDEVIQGMTLTKGGEVVHPSLVKEGA